VWRVVIDSNVLISARLSPRGASGQQFPLHKLLADPLKSVVGEYPRRSARAANLGDPFGRHLRLNGSAHDFLSGEPKIRLGHHHQKNVRPDFVRRRSAASTTERSNCQELWMRR
jgi:hypothetical protein